MDLNQLGSTSDPTFAITDDHPVTAAGSETDFRLNGSATPGDTFSVQLFNGPAQVSSTYLAPTAINTGFIGFVITLPLLITASVLIQRRRRA